MKTPTKGSFFLYLQNTEYPIEYNLSLLFREIKNTGENFMAKTTSINGKNYSLLVDFVDGKLLQESSSREVFLHLPKLDEMIKLEIHEGEEKLKVTTAAKSRIFIGGIELGKKVGSDTQSSKLDQKFNNTVYVKRNDRSIILVTNRSYELESICIAQFG